MVPLMTLKPTFAKAAPRKAPIGPPARAPMKPPAPAIKFCLMLWPSARSLIFSRSLFSSTIISLLSLLSS